MKAIERTGVDYYCQISDVNLLKNLVESLPENPMCINIGSAYGTSALAMLEARPDSCVISIDIEDCPEEQMVMNENGFSDSSRYHFVKDKSQSFGLHLREESVDLIFIDGGHKYKECYEDAIVYYKILKPNGIMAFHDYESKIRVLESVKRAVDDVSKELELELIEREGTLIAFRKVVR